MDSKGQYELGKRIAVGGMAEIYLGSAGDDAFRRPVVIKKVLPKLSSEDRFVRMLIDEAKITARLNHVNIVQILDLVQGSDGECFIVMEFVQGKDLRNITARAGKNKVALPLSVILYIVAEICEALDYAHRLTDDQGRPLHLIHRDVSPSNILISTAGEVKLADFGVARFGRDTTQVGSLKGKIAYMSPEQARGETVDHRTDIFSVGAVLFELLTGVRIYRGESDIEILKKAREGNVPMPSLLKATLHTQLERILLRALAAPGDRFQSGAEMASLLRAFAFENCDPPGSPAALAKVLTLLFTSKELEAPSILRSEKTLNTIAGFRQGKPRRPAFADEHTQPGEPSTRLIARSRRQDGYMRPDTSLLDPGPSLLGSDTSSLPGMDTNVLATDTKPLLPKRPSGASGKLRAVDTESDSGAIRRILSEHPVLAEPTTEQQAAQVPSPGTLVGFATTDTADVEGFDENEPTRVAEPEIAQTSDARFEATASSFIPLKAIGDEQKGTSQRSKWLFASALLTLAAAAAGLFFFLVFSGDSAPTPPANAMRLPPPGSKLRPKPVPSPVARPQLKAPADAPDAATSPDMRTVRLTRPKQPADAGAPSVKVSRNDAKKKARSKERTRPKRRETRVARAATKAKSRPRATKSSPPHTHEKTKRSGGKGQLLLKSDPWAYIIVNGRKTSRVTSARPFALRAGRHTIKLENPSLGLSKTITIEVKAGQMVRRFVKLR